MTFGLQGTEASITFSFSHQDVLDRAAEPVSLLDSTELLQRSSIDYVLVSRARSRDIARFDADPSLRVVYSNEEIAIFGF